MTLSERLILTADAIVTPQGIIDSGWVELDGAIIREVHSGPAPVDAVRLDGVITPGFVDIHVHGAVGHDFSSADAQGVAEAARYHWSRGTTSLVASVASTAKDALVAQLAVLSPLVDEGMLAGIHLEGPHLSAARCGAHSIDLLRDPDPSEIAEMLSHHAGRVVMITLAPELPGALSTIRAVVQSGVHIAIGHTDGDTATIRAAIDAGATVATHLFNGMPPFNHREAGPVGVLLTDDRVVVELILDGAHLSTEAETIALRTALGRAIGVSDAMAATGQPDGVYLLAGNTIDVVDGVARARKSGSLAGSTSPLAVAATRLRRDHQMSLEAIVHTLSSGPADALGLDQVGRIAPRNRADLLLIDADNFAVNRVMRGGRWLS